MNEEYLNTNQLSGYVGFTDEQIRKAIRKGKNHPPLVKVNYYYGDGYFYLFLRADIDRWEHFLRETQEEEENRRARLKTEREERKARRYKEIQAARERVIQRKRTGKQKYLYMKEKATAPPTKVLTPKEVLNIKKEHASFFVWKDSRDRRLKKQKKQRTCIRCECDFLSNGPFHRVCSDCRPIIFASDRRAGWLEPDCSFVDLFGDVHDILKQYIVAPIYEEMSFYD